MPSIPTTAPRGSALPWLCLAAIVIASTLLGLRTLRDPKMDFGDGLEYLAGAYHLRHDGVFSQASTDGPAAPGLGREPGYAAVLALLMALDPGVGAYRPLCQPSDPDCAPKRYRAISVLNLAFIEAAGILTFLVARRLTGQAGAGLAAAAYLLLDASLMRSHWYDPMSDQLALFLVAAAMTALVFAWGSGSRVAWAALGLVLGGATLVKAAFLPFCLICGVVAVAAVARGPRPRGGAVGALAAAAVVYAAVTGAWILRNQHVSGMARLTDSRGGIALSTRAVFDRMTPAQFAAAFVFWTPDFGERLARRVFAPETVARFDLYAPGGFYDVGQNGYGQRVDALMRSDGLDAWTASARVDRQILADIAAAPFGYALSTLPLLYRGAWIDQFGILGLALLLWTFGLALRRRDGPLLCILGFGLYNELFYALISLNIPRYQMTALPAIAVAAGVVLTRVIRRIRARGRREANAAYPAPPRSAA